MRRLPLLIPAFALLGLSGPAPALAQMAAPPRAQTAPGPRPPPPALPGLATRRAPEPIPGDPTQNLAPNAALFDAITRGDLAAVRDAVARGANLEARNVLGLTPVDAAVDQGRHEIAFYLLSARGASGGGRSDPLPDSLPSAPPSASAQPAPPAAPRAPMNVPPAVAAGMAQEAAASRSARLWAGDGGAPVPERGFLGFDAGRPAGSAPAPAAPRTTRGGRG
jgi:hypothetical protein